MNKRILIIEVCRNKPELQECKGICEQAKLYGIETTCKMVKSNDQLKSLLSSKRSYDYIYLSAHSCAESFGSEDGQVDMSWADFATLLCNNRCMNEDGVLMLSCCRGGLMQVAYTLFSVCGEISYVLGPRQSLTSEDMHICFGIFLYNIEVRRLDPVVACEKIKLATDQRFSCYDRQVEELNLGRYAYDGFWRGLF